MFVFLISKYLPCLKTNICFLVNKYLSRFTAGPSAISCPDQPPPNQIASQQVSTASSRQQNKGVFLKQKVYLGTKLWSFTFETKQIEMFCICRQSVLLGLRSP